MARLRKETAGFSLIEVMMVVSVISFLTVLVMPTVNSARDQAVVLKCVSNQRQIWEAVHRYEFDFNTTLFTIRNNGVAIRNTLYTSQYIKNPSAFECPASRVADNDDITLTYEGIDFATTRCGIVPLKHVLK